MTNIHKNILHLEPDKGLLNDPNGLAYFNGKYYIFHQWNRFGVDHSYKEWGLFTSQDLLHWEHEGSAILPDSLHDKDGVYSGNAVVYQNEMRVFYTGNTRVDGKRRSYQRQAVLHKPFQFIKQNDVITTPSEFTEHFRDPYVVKTINGWRMLIGAQTKQYVGVIVSYFSYDCRKWKYEGIYFSNSILDQMCECPNLVDFGNEQVLLVCPQRRSMKSDKDISSYSGYFIGHQSGNKFLPDTPIRILDEGFDFYAPQVFEDGKGRKILVAWMSRMSSDQEKNCPTLKFGYLHCLTIPRELIMKHNQLYQRPAHEYIKASSFVKHYFQNNISFNSSNGFDVFEMEVNQNHEFDIDLFNKNIILSFHLGELKLSRKNWVDGEYEKKIIHIKHITKLEFYCDRSALEVFINDGEKVMSLRYFCFEEKRKNTFSSDTEFDLNIKRLNI